MAATSGSNDPPIGESDTTGEKSSAWRIQPIPPGLINKPIDYIFAEHNRQRDSTIILLMIAAGEFDKEGVTKLIEFFEVDFALHIGDEEVALFPLLRQHCLPEDKIDRILLRLQDEHRKDEANVEDIIEALKRCLAGEPITSSTSLQLRLFADHIHSHLALENGVVLPIARVRLRGEELKVLTDMLKQRRSN